jgi:sugar phosphate permease
MGIGYFDVLDIGLKVKWQMQFIIVSIYLVLFGILTRFMLVDNPEKLGFIINLPEEVTQALAIEETDNKIPKKLLKISQIFCIDGYPNY